MAAIAAHKLQIIRTLVETAPDAALRSLELALSGAGSQGALASVRGPIHDVLRERQLNREVAKWTAELKKKARIQDVLASATGPTEPLPPVVLELGLQPGAAAGTGGGGAGTGAAGGDG